MVKLDSPRPGVPWKRRYPTQHPWGRQFRAKHRIRAPSYRNRHLGFTVLDPDQIPNTVERIDVVNAKGLRRTTASFASCRATDLEAATALSSSASCPKASNEQFYLDAMKSRGGRSPGQPMPKAIQIEGTPLNRERSAAEPATGTVKVAVQSSKKSGMAAPIRVPSQGPRGSNPKTIQIHTSGKSPATLVHRTVR
ncbi:MAG: hypothetical protein M1813_009757 [Trichoglossum hirsutum]|jgi:hypothetical protein|nr:MAG: hypothetical protein M1813_009757 [Trichoglossum hirsutum]